MFSNTCIRFFFKFLHNIIASGLAVGICGISDMKNIHFPACIGLACSDMMISLTGNCTYVISIDSSPWLYSGPTRFQANGHHHSTADETLKLTRPPDKGHGVDTLGPFVRQVYTWKAGNADVQTAIKLYDDIEAIVFSQVCIE